MSSNSNNDWIYLEHKDISKKDMEVFISASMKPPVGHIPRKYYTEQLAKAYEIYLKKKNALPKMKADVDTYSLRFRLSVEKKPIVSFREEYSFLSNSYAAPIKYDNLSYRDAEDAYRAAKSKGSKERAYLHLDWEDAKVEIMRDILRIKFKQGTKLAGKLLATGSRDLVYGSRYNVDTFWGYDLYNGYGNNVLGRLLMEIRSDLQNAPEAHEVCQEAEEQEQQESADDTGWMCYRNSNFALNEDEAAAQFDDAWAASLYTLEPPPENRWR